MVDVVMRLGHRLGLEVIAEGTTPMELAAVVAAGCRFGQGRLLGWGVPAEHLAALLEAAAAWSGDGRLPVPGQRAGAAGPAIAAIIGPNSAGASGATSLVQDVRCVDSAREMRQA